MADVLALKRDIPLVQRFNHLIVECISSVVVEKAEGEKRTRRSVQWGPMH